MWPSDKFSCYFLSPGLVCSSGAEFMTRGLTKVGCLTPLEAWELPEYWDNAMAPVDEANGTSRCSTHRRCLGVITVNSHALIAFINCCSFDCNLYVQPLLANLLRPSTLVWMLGPGGIFFQTSVVVLMPLGLEGRWGSRTRKVSVVGPHAHPTVTC